MAPLRRILKTKFMCENRVGDYPRTPSESSLFRANAPPNALDGMCLFPQCLPTRVTHTIEIGMKMAYDFSRV